MKRFFVLPLIFLATVASAQQSISSLFPTQPSGYITDAAKILSPADVQRLDAKIAEIDSATKGQIAIAILPTIADYPPNEVAMTIGRQWGPGVKSDSLTSLIRNNGIVMLIVPKTASVRGQCFIAPAQHMQGFITDADAGDICRNDMVPHFKTGDYAGGVEAGVEQLRTKYAEAAAEANLPKKAPVQYQPDWPIIILVVIGSVLLIGFLIWFFSEDDDEETAPTTSYSDDTIITAATAGAAASTFVAPSHHHYESPPSSHDSSYESPRSSHSSDDDSSSGGSSFGGFGGGSGFDGGGGGSSW
jgi:uncharacterized protein